MKTYAQLNSKLHIILNKQRIILVLEWRSLHISSKWVILVYISHFAKQHGKKNTEITRERAREVVRHDSAYTIVFLHIPTPCLITVNVLLMTSHSYPTRRYVTLQLWRERVKHISVLYKTIFPAGRGRNHFYHLLLECGIDLPAIWQYACAFTACYAQVVAILI